MNNSFKEVVQSLRRAYTDKEIEQILLEYKKIIIKEYQEEVTEKLIDYFKKEMK